MSALGRGAIVAAALALSALPASAAELAPQRPGVTDVYFVGVAAWGSQDVFLSEARGAAAIVADAYCSPDRQMILANGAARPPAATDASLRAALKSVAKVMDPREDVLFLLLTSHGSPEGVGFEAGGSVFEMLSPRELRRALDGAGIRNAVVVVSACCSGVFRGLASKDRLVVMAARPDRPSFGCKDGNRWTYFGEAFFDGALKREPDPLKAFSEARAIVSRRERSEGFKPSEPQIAGGGRVAAKLRAAAQN